LSYFLLASLAGEVIFMQKEIPLKLLRAALSAAENAYAPYSRFAVGAAVETTDGQIFSGANMENASYGLTVCAEVGALQAASVSGLLGNVSRIAIAGGLIKAAKKSVGEIVTPCGRCRQLILESAHISETDIEVWCANLDLSAIECFKISELLPHGFGPRNLGAVEIIGQVPKIATQVRGTK
jgi:cytidine deaminase